MDTEETQLPSESQDSGIDSWEESTWYSFPDPTPGFCQLKTKQTKPAKVEYHTASKGKIPEDTHSSLLSVTVRSTVTKNNPGGKGLLHHIVMAGT